jgi:uncharacterized membrane protein
MRRYKFEVRQELITPIEVMAETEQQARERVFRQDQNIALFDILYGDMQVVLRSVDGD